jgi:hypothetical protein
MESSEMSIASRHRYIALSRDLWNVMYKAYGKKENACTVLSILRD